MMQEAGVVANYVSNAFVERRAGNATAYRQMVAQLRVETDPRALTRYLEALTACVSSISNHSPEIVEAVLALPWIRHYGQEDLVIAYLDFAETLLSSHAPFALPCMRLAITLLSYAPGSPVRDTLGDASDAVLSSAYSRVHDLLSTILRVVPTSMHALLPLINDQYPHKKLDAKAHVWYVKNLINITGYANAMLPDILAIIIERIIQIDVEIQVDLDESGSSTSPSDAYHADDEDDFDMEMEDGVVSRNDNVASEHVRAMADKLDGVLFLVFEFLQTRCLENPAVRPQDVLLTLLPPFERIVMTTGRSRYTQFLFFYFVCASPPELHDQYLSWLMHILVDPAKSVIVRQSAASYIASFVSRARPVSLSSTRLCLDLLSQWLSAYIDYFETSGQSEMPEGHTLFYYVCQAVFYIICFRHVALFSHQDGVDGPAAMARLALDRVVTCRLNPLRVCLGNVVNEFARVMHEQQIVYCYTTLQRNARMMGANRSGNTSPTRGNGGNATPVTPSVDYFLSRDAVDFESFFAFEPMNLTRSAPFVEPFYQQWEEREESDDVMESVAASGAAAAQMNATNGSAGMIRGRTASAPMATRTTAAVMVEDDEDDELANFIISPESVGMQFMFDMRAGNGTGSRAQPRKR